MFSQESGGDSKVSSELVAAKRKAPVMPEAVPTPPKVAKKKDPPAEDEGPAAPYVRGLGDRWLCPLCGKDFGAKAQITRYYVLYLA